MANGDEMDECDNWVDESVMSARGDEGTRVGIRTGTVGSVDRIWNTKEDFKTENKQEIRYGIEPATGTGTGTGTGIKTIEGSRLDNNDRGDKEEVMVNGDEMDECDNWVDEFVEKVMSFRVDEGERSVNWEIKTMEGSKLDENGRGDKKEVMVTVMRWMSTRSVITGQMENQGRSMSMWRRS